MTNYIVGLIAGRHDMPVKGYILNEVENVFDFDLMANKIENWINSHLTFSNHCGHATNQMDYYDILLSESNQRLVVYVTGLTAVVAELIRVCLYKGVHLTLMHYDRDNNEYKPQVIS